METVPNTNAADAKAQLKDQFPDWSIIHTDRGRWWATRPTLVREDLSRTDGATFDADTPEQLAAKIREATRGE